jgi:uncharacterized protein (TIGR03435 family)
MIAKAFAIPDFQVIWPEWMRGVPRDHPAKEKPDVRYFTITATVPPGTSSAELQVMLQNLLIDRFGLVLHRETRQREQYEVSFVPDGPRMPVANPVSSDPAPGLPEDNEDIARILHQNTNHLAFGRDDMLVTGDYTVAGIAALFSGYLKYPMVDRTGSEEYYAIKLTCGWNPYSAPPLEGMNNHAMDSDAKALFSEMEKKLGLKVTLRSAPTEFLSHRTSPP